MGEGLKRAFRATKETRTMKPDIIPHARYEVRTGKFGQYFYDKHLQYDLTLAEVANLLNSIDPLREQLESAVFKSAAMNAQPQATAPSIQKPVRVTGFRDNPLRLVLNNGAECLIDRSLISEIASTAPIAQGIERLRINPKVLEYARQVCEGDVRTIPDAHAGQQFAQELLRLSALTTQPAPSPTAGAEEWRPTANAAAVAIKGSMQGWAKKEMPPERFADIQSVIEALISAQASKVAELEARTERLENLLERWVSLWSLSQEPPHKAYPTITHQHKMANALADETIAALGQEGENKGGKAHGS